MADFYGKGYVIDYCIAFFRKIEEEEVYRIYVTDALQVISQNTANLAGGKTIGIRYYDIIKPQQKEEANADEIINRIKDKLSKMGSEK
jgi:hypothetical protein